MFLLIKIINGKGNVPNCDFAKIKKSSSFAAGQISSIVKRLSILYDSDKQRDFVCLQDKQNNEDKGF